MVQQFVSQGVSAIALAPLDDKALVNPVTAAAKNVVIIRHANGQRYGASIDMRPVLAGEASEQFYLEPHDGKALPPGTIGDALL